MELKHFTYFQRLTSFWWALTDSNRRPNWIGLVNLQTVVSQLFIMVLIFLQSEW